jgi:translation initiation factor 1
MAQKKNTRSGSDGGFSYSTQHGELCGICFAPKSKCTCLPLSTNSDGVVRVGRSTKGRKGAGVTTISGVPLKGAELKAFAKKLKQRCGSGGTLRDGVIEVQGEHQETVVGELEKRGWVVKRSGGLPGQ